MTALDVAVIGGLGALGAVVRLEVTSRAPDGLLAVHVLNVLGAFALGLLVATDVADRTVLWIGGGLLGATTTFSTWLVGAAERRATTHVALPLALGVLAAVAGRLTATLMGLA